MADEQQIMAALQSLDHDNADLWTESGLPALDHLRVKLNEPTLSRKEVSKVMPGFVRNSTGPRDVAGNRYPRNEGDGNDGNEGEGPIGQTESRPVPTVEQIAAAVPDAVLLLEAVVAVSQTDRYRRNSELQTLVRHYMVSQRPIKEIQERLDVRNAARAEAAAVAEEAAKA